MIQNKRPKVSVIIPIYNAEKYLHVCLDSVVNQTLKEIEVICVDDGSTDASLRIAKEYSEKDSRVRVCSQKNSSAGAARNKGLSYATGEYLSFLDADDFFELNMLEYAYDKATEVRADIVVFRSDLFYEDQNRYAEMRYTIVEENLPEKRPFSGTEVKRDIFKSFIGWAWDKLFLREYVLENELSFQVQRTSNDLYFTYLALAKAKRITTLEDLLAHHRTNVKSSLEATRSNSWDCFYKALLKLREGLIQSNLYDHFEKDYISYCIHFSLWNLNTLKGPVRKILFNKLKNGWLQEMGVLDFKGCTHTDLDENIQSWTIIHCPYALEIVLFKIIESGMVLKEIITSRFRYLRGDL